MPVQLLVGSILKRSLPALLHLVLTFFFVHRLLVHEYFDFVLNAGFFILVIVNFITTSFVSKGEWKQLIISVAVCFLYTVLYVLIMPLFGGLYESDSDNPGDGFTAMFGLVVSIIAFFMGTMLGIVFPSLRRQIKSFFGKA